MENPTTISPAKQLRASRTGILAGILLVVWAIVFSLFKTDMSPLVYWGVFVSVALLIGAVPAWLAGRRAKRDYLERQTPPV
jgi:hypothetical protein